MDGRIKTQQYWGSLQIWSVHNHCVWIIMPSAMVRAFFVLLTPHPPVKNGIKLTVTSYKLQVSSIQGIYMGSSASIILEETKKPLDASDVNTPRGQRWEFSFNLVYLMSLHKMFTFQKCKRGSCSAKKNVSRELWDSFSALVFKNIGFTSACWPIRTRTICVWWWDRISRFFPSFIFSTFHYLTANFGDKVANLEDSIDEIDQSKAQRSKAPKVPYNQRRAPPPEDRASPAELEALEEELDVSFIFHIYKNLVLWKSFSRGKCQGKFERMIMNHLSMS